MEKLYGLSLALVILTACGGDEKGAGINSTIAGTYVRKAEGEYSNAMDTLIVAPYYAKTGTFIIMRRTAYYRIKDGKLQPQERKQERLISVWDEKTHQLRELKEGKLYTFPAGGRELLAGTAKYLKIE